MNDQKSRKEQDTARDKPSQIWKKQVRESAKRAAIGGGLAGLITFFGAWLIGNVSSGEAAVLLNIALPAARSFAANILLATGTILALMLTLLSFSYNTEFKLKLAHYQRVKQIAWIDTITLIGAVLTFLLLNVPIEEAGGDAVNWLTFFYYASLVLSSLLGAAIITIVLMLYETIKDIIEVIKPGETDESLQSRLLRDEKSE